MSRRATAMRLLAALVLAPVAGASAGAATGNATGGSGGLPPFVHYRSGGAHEREQLANGVLLERWNSPAPAGQLLGMPSELTGRPPYLTRLTLGGGGEGGQGFPPEGGAYSLDVDVAYLVLRGRVRCGHCGRDDAELSAGDIFFAPARTLHGGLVSAGGAVVIAVTARRFAYRTSPSPRPGFLQGLGQTLRQGPPWGPSGLGLFESETCMRTGGVRVGIWPSMAHVTNVLAVSLGSDCMIPCHSHLGGALYLVIDGALLLDGDGDGLTTLHTGDLRWASAGHVYGPERSSASGRAELRVLGMPGTVVPPQVCHEPS